MPYHQIYHSRRLSFIQNPDKTVKMIPDSEAKRRNSLFNKTKTLIGFEKPAKVITFKNSPRTKRYLSDFAFTSKINKEDHHEDHYSRDGYSDNEEMVKKNESSDDFSADGKSEDFDGSDGGDGDSDDSGDDGGNNAGGDKADDNGDGESLEEGLQRKSKITVLKFEKTTSRIDLLIFINRSFANSRFFKIAVVKDVDQYSYSDARDDRDDDFQRLSCLLSFLR